MEFFLHRKIKKIVACFCVFYKILSIETVFQPQKQHFKAERISSRFFVNVAESIIHSVLMWVIMFVVVGHTVFRL